MNSVEFDLFGTFFPMAKPRNLPSISLTISWRSHAEALDLRFWRPKNGRREVPHEDADLAHDGAHEEAAQDRAHEEAMQAELMRRRRMRSAA